MKADSESITVDAVARIVHNAQRDLGYWLDDPYPPAPYDAIPEAARAPVQSLVRLIAGGYPAEYVQEMWVEKMTQEGWIWGPDKDPVRKTHPCMVEWRFLPSWEKKKVHLAYNIIQGAFTGSIDLS